MPTKRNRRVGVQSRKVKKPKNFSRKLSVSGKAKKRRSSTHGSSTHRSGTHRSGTRRRVQRGGDPTTLTALGAIVTVVGGLFYAIWRANYYNPEQVELRKREAISRATRWQPE